MKGEISRRASSNLPQAASAALSSVAVHSSRWYTPMGTAVVGGLAGGALINGGALWDNSSLISVGHIPMVGQTLGSMLSTVDHLPLVGTGVVVVTGYIAMRKVGDPLQRWGKRQVEKHQLS